ncbi:ABC transporter ATP-binding protein [Peptococcaceae bacterium]|nr:ABC transporter ATP-binding protein [Peptococcaceae bacterium]
MNIKFNNVSKAFNNQLAIDSLNLEIENGEFIALLGPSGCGKSTTLMMLAGLYKPTAGEIYFGSVVVNDLEPKERNIGMVFQSYALYPHLTVLENIAFPLKQQKVPKKERLRRAEEVAELVHLQEFLQRWPSQLSGGQQQRVAIARALVKKPDLLLLDEPMSNLDTRLKNNMRNEVCRLQKQLKITTVLVTHDQEEAMIMADRVAILDAGKIQQFDPPEKLFNKPKNLFVAHFMGNPPMNFLEGRLVNEGNQQVVVADDWRYAFTKEKALPEKHTGKQVKLGIRAHQLAITQESKDALPAKLLALEYLGREVIIRAAIGKQNVCVFVENMVANNLPKHFYLYPDWEGVHVFDEETGENLSLQGGRA